jgi:myo-inositol 2-dehydrogenase / D-chiro-inositol 1-dehydrogenase
MRVGLTGVGRIGQMHAANLAATTGVDEIVLHDPVRGRAAEVAAAVGVLGAVAAGTTAPRVTAVGSDDRSYAELLGRVDAVMVTTPTPAHADAVLAALDAGVATLVEKPLAGDTETMNVLIERAERPGTAPLLVGFQRRFDPGIAELKRRIVTGEIGDLYVVRATAFDATPPPAEYLPTSGGIFRDLFIHDLDCVPWLVGRPVVQVHAVGSVLVDRAFADAGDVDTAAITLVFEGGVIAQIAGGRRQGTGYDNRIEAAGSKAAFASGWDRRTPVISLEPGGHHPGDRAYDGFPARYARAYAAEVATFLEVAAGRAENPSPPRDSLVSLALAEACESSLRSGAAVCLA